MTLTPYMESTLRDAGFRKADELVTCSIERETPIIEFVVNPYLPEGWIGMSQPNGSTFFLGPNGAHVTIEPFNTKTELGMRR